MDILYKSFGPIIKLDPILGRPPMIFLFDPESSAQVLRGENWMPTREGFETIKYYRKTVKQQKRLANNEIKEIDLDPVTGLITDHGEVWRNFRLKVNPVLMQPKTMKLYTSVIDEVALDMIKRLKSLRDDNNMITKDFGAEMNLWSLESIGVVALGTRLGCFDPNLPSDSPAKRLIKCVHDIFKYSNELDFKLSFWRYYPTKTFKNAMKTYEEQDEIAKYFVSEAVKKINLNPGSKEEEKGVLEKLLDIDEEVAHIMANDMLFAGVDTTATTITGTLYLLAKNPEKQEKLREEIKAKKEDKFLKACIKESLRIMPITGGNMRSLSKEYNLLGYKIPKKMYVVFGHQYMSVMEDQFPRPFEFIPERWIADKNDPLYYGNAHPFAYNPFGFGVRSCIGRRIAQLEIETFLSRLIENFKVEWHGPPVKVEASSINYVKGPYYFKLIDL